MYIFMGQKNILGTLAVIMLLFLSFYPVLWSIFTILEWGLNLFYSLVYVCYSLLILKSQVFVFQ